MGLSVLPRYTCPQNRWGLGKSPDPRVLLVVLGQGLAGHVLCAVSHRELAQVGCGRDPSDPSSALSLAAEMGLYAFPAISALFWGDRVDSDLGTRFSPPASASCCWGGAGKLRHSVAQRCTGVLRDVKAPSLIPSGGCCLLSPSLGTQHPLGHTRCRLGEAMGQGTP